MHIDLWNRLKVFLSDLQTFENNQDARNRSEYDPSATLYMSRVYFTEHEVEMLLNVRNNTGKNGSCYVKETITRVYIA